MATQLTEQILALSQSKIWAIAKSEWKLSAVYFAEEYETCLCGHYPIKELCIISNKETGNSATVGNCCVKNFMGLPSDKIFQSIKKIKKDNTANINAELLSYAYNQNWINDWEHSFYEDTISKRKLTERQLEKKQQINDKILLKMNRKL
jgi:hypothetical protein